MAAFCHHCGVRLQPEVQFCPECGAATSGTVGIAVQPQVEVQPSAQAAQRNRRPRNLGIVIFILVVFVIAIAVLNHKSQSDTNSEGTSNAAPADRPIILPPLETKFIEIVATAQSDSQQTQNDMQKGGVKAKRDQLICGTMTSSEVQDWIGTVQTIDSNSDGKGVLAISIAPDVLVTTWNNAFSDIEAHTLIEPNSPVFESASAMKPGQLVAFSGNFFLGSDGDCLLESSLTLNGKLQSPDFIFQFSKVSAYDPSPEPSQAPQGPSPAPAQETNPPADGSETAQEPTPAPVENPNPPAAQPAPASATPTESQGETASENVDAEVSSTLDNWAKAYESNDPTRIANCYADQVDRYFLRQNVTNTFVHDYMEAWLKAHDSRVTMFGIKDLTFENETAGSVTLALVKQVVTTDSKGATERLTRSQLILKKIAGEWKITSERDFK
jgi:ketosteroid isomerase-like protein